MNLCEANVNIYLNLDIEVLTLFAFNKVVVSYSFLSFLLFKITLLETRKNNLLNSSRCNLVVYVSLVIITLKHHSTDRH
jgi:hypothetical protein